MVGADGVQVYFCTAPLPAGLTGTGGGPLVTQHSRAPGGTLAGDARLPLLPTGPLGTHAAGVAPWQGPLCPPGAHHPAQVLEVTVDADVVDAAVEQGWASLRAGAQGRRHHLGGHAWRETGESETGESETGESEIGRAHV